MTSTEWAGYCYYRKSGQPHARRSLFLHEATKTTPSARKLTGAFSSHFRVRNTLKTVIHSGRCGPAVGSAFVLPSRPLNHHDPIVKSSPRCVSYLSCFSGAPSLEGNSDLRGTFSFFPFFFAAEGAPLPTSAVHGLSVFPWFVPGLTRSREGFSRRPYWSPTVCSSIRRIPS